MKANDVFDIEQAARLSRRNRAAVKAAVHCGCYYCLRTFESSAVKEWADLDEQTALCPLCAIDSVLPNVTDVAVLNAANERWFCEALDDKSQ